MQKNIDKSWEKYLKDEFDKQYMLDISNFLNTQRQVGKIIYPKQKDIFNALKYTSFSDIKVVILGQDPYHGEGQAHGLAFSVLDGVNFPPSLRNIFKELNSDLGIDIPKTGNLEKWARQGVLLLNTVLTVEKDKPASHSNIAWQQFTDTIIEIISKEKAGVIFILWGNYAKTKKKLIDIENHFIIEGPHPSPLSAYRGFFGSKPFSKVNEILKNNGRNIINW